MSREWVVFYKDRSQDVQRLFVKAESAREALTEFEEFNGWKGYEVVELISSKRILEKYP